MQEHTDLKDIIISASVVQLLYDQNIAEQRFYKSNIESSIGNVVKYKGDYSGTFTYTTFNIVTYNYKAYMCISASPIVGVVPTDTNSWIQMSIVGPSGSGMSFFTSYDNTYTYTISDCLPYANKLYVSIVNNNLNHQPDISPNYWSPIITVPYQTIISNIQPTGQDSNGYWHQTNSTDNSYKVMQSNGDGTYTQKYPVSNASLIKTTDGSNVQAKLDEDNKISTYIHTYDPATKIHNLQGTGSNIKFLATADYHEGDTWTVNGQTVTASTQDNQELSDGYFKNGAWVSSIIFKDGKLNFKLGGGGYGTLPAQVSNFYATIGNASVALAWTNPGDDNFAGVLIVRKTGGYPVKPGDGVKIYQGTAQAYTDTGLTNGTQYYYRAFAYNDHHEYQTVYCVATMTPQAGYALGSLPINTKIKFGSIFGHPIVQKIANISGSDVTLISDGILARYAFDAEEPLNSNSDRRNCGNNRYIYSNIHQWLNSEAGAGSWYVAQHSADQAPASASVVTMNPYKSVAGFLNGFSVKEKNYLKTKTITVGKVTTDGGGTETFNARFWLPSGTEVGLATDFTEGSQLQAFSDNNSRIAYETADCAAYTGGTAGAALDYWLRTPHVSDASAVRIVDSDGTLTISQAYNGTVGVRPLCVLDSSVLVSLTVDSDGCYTVL